ncbi:late lactation protein B-like [Antechinus flavipes]|uniref:late lactation protein B-like n=1 Tax=Antechinus flavipes TaxID=38775 RepID=UPI0022368A75|nr:late lactation protein B-like [Antechinus flavipes]
MKILFLTIVLSLFSILQAQETSPTERFGGTYVVKAIVADIKREKPKFISPLTITNLDNGNLEVKFTFNKHGKCKEIKMTLEKTNNPRLFSMVSSEGRHQVFIEETSVRDHWIILCEGEIHGKYVKVAKLVGPSTEENPKAFEDYKKFVSIKGFNEERIHIPIQAEACTPEEA